MPLTLRTARLRRGVSVTELAHAVGVNRSTITRLETGLRLPLHDTAQRLEKVLECALKFTRVSR